MRWDLKWHSWFWITSAPVNVLVGPIKSLVCRAWLGWNIDFLLSSVLCNESEKKFTHLSPWKVNSFYEHLWVEFFADINFKIFEGKQRHATTRLYTENRFISIDNCQTTSKVTVTLHLLQGWVEVSVILNCHQHWSLTRMSLFWAVDIQ